LSTIDTAGFDLRATRFGGRRAFARHLLSRAGLAAGAYRSYRAIDWRRVRRVVFVCRGNICRSPYAERGLVARGFPAISAGLDCAAGSVPPPAALRVAAARGVALDGHGARPLDSVTLQPGDLVAAFEPGHAAALARAFQGRDDVQVTLVGAWSRPPFPYLHDPYALSDAYFDVCYSRIDDALDRIRQQITFVNRPDANAR